MASKACNRAGDGAGHREGCLRWPFAATNGSSSANSHGAAEVPCLPRQCCEARWLSGGRERGEAGVVGCLVGVDGQTFEGATGQGTGSRGVPADHEKGAAGRGPSPSARAPSCLLSSCYCRLPRQPQVRQGAGGDDGSACGGFRGSCHKNGP